MLLAVCLCLVGGWLAWLWHKGARLREMGEKLPGPKTYPIVGNALQIGINTAELIDKVLDWSAQYRGQPFRVWIGPQALYILLTEPADVEVMLSSRTLIAKANQYDLLQPWLGTGLLLSTGAKWHRHRKILTPSFHFKILEDNIDVFNANGKILVEKLGQHVDGPTVDIYKYITLCALDNICESAMGVQIHAQSNSESDYVNAVRNMTYIFVRRNSKPWLLIDQVFNMTSLKATYDKSLEILHATTNHVIKSRRAEMILEKKQQVEPKEDASQSDGVLKRLAFLDMLIESTFEGSLLTDENIREEVDTFMFEGHDTTSSAISFTLWLLSWHQDVQERVYKELQATFPDQDEAPTFKGLQELKYLERVIKETLRMYPSVPAFARQLNEDVVLSGGFVAPKGATITVAALAVHMNPNVFPDPEKFDPDRFLPENVQGRHPYAYVPFSAGLRNCIGQKFAMLELKSTVAHVLRRYKLLPGAPQHEMRLAYEVTLVSTTGIRLKLVSRGASPIR